jgi:hypothetical protein
VLLSAQSERIASARSNFPIKTREALNRPSLSSSLSLPSQVSPSLLSLLTPLLGKKKEIPCVNISPTFRSTFLKPHSKIQSLSLIQKQIQKRKERGDASVQRVVASAASGGDEEGGRGVCLSRPIGEGHVGWT